MDELPENVLDAVRRNRKIEAIKLLRSKNNIDLKGARDTIDAVIAKHPEYGNPRRYPQTETGMWRVAALLFLIALMYGLYKWLT